MLLINKYPELKLLSENHSLIILKLSLKPIIIESANIIIPIRTLILRNIIKYTILKNLWNLNIKFKKFALIINLLIY